MGSVSLHIAGRSQSLSEVGRDLWRTSNPNALLPCHQLTRNMNGGAEQHMNATETVPGHGSEDSGFRSQQSLKL